MTSENIFPTFMGFIIVCTCLLAAVSILGIVGIFYYFFRQKSKVFQAADKALEVDTGTYLAEATNQVLPWEPNALSNFSSHLAITGRRIWRHYTIAAR